MVNAVEDFTPPIAEDLRAIHRKLKMGEPINRLSEFRAINRAANEIEALVAELRFQHGRIQVLESGISK